MASIFVFVPAYGNQVSVATFQSVMGLMPALMNRGITGGLATFSYPEVSEIRNIALTAWYDMPDNKASHLLFVDSDMGFSSDLVLDMLLFDRPMVGAIYPKKTLPIQWAASGLGDKAAERRGNFMKVAGLGMGCFLIQREAVTRMIEAFPELVDSRIELHAAKHMLPAGRVLRFFDPMDNPDSGRMSEDLAFCYRWRTGCNGEVWAAVGHQIEHVGQYSYKASYLEEIAKKDLAEESRLAYQPNSAA